MPLQELAVGSGFGRLWQPNRAVVQPEIFFAVAEVVFQPAPRAKFVVGRDSDIACVEQPMDVGAEKNTVVYTMFAAFCYWLYVSGFQRRKSFFTGYRTVTFVRVGYEYSERALTEALFDKGIPPLNRSLTDLILLSPWRSQAHLDGVQKLFPRSLLGVVSLALHDVFSEVFWNGNPLVTWQKEGLLKQNATDLEVFVRINIGVTVIENLSPHFGESGGAVFLTEGFPRQTDR
jgi:hypothetical protein